MTMHSQLTYNKNIMACVKTILGETDMLMNRMFVHTKIFDKKWRDIGYGDDTLLEVQKTICENPQGYPIIQGTGGIRKIRVSADGKGKSGGGRVLYVDFPDKGIVGLIYAYPKSQQEDIDDEERKILKGIVEQIRENWRG